MALIDCPECKNEISDKAASCPHCGCPLSGIFKDTFMVNCLGCKTLFPINNESCPECGLFISQKYNQPEIRNANERETRELQSARNTKPQQAITPKHNTIAGSILFVIGTKLACLYKVLIIQKIIAAFLLAIAIMSIYYNGITAIVTFTVAAILVFPRTRFYMRNLLGGIPSKIVSLWIVGICLFLGAINLASAIENTEKEHKLRVDKERREAYQQSIKDDFMINRLSIIRQAELVAKAGDFNKLKALTDKYSFLNDKKINEIRRLGETNYILDVIKNLKESDIEQNLNNYKKLVKLNPNATMYQIKFNHFQQLANKQKTIAEAAKKKLGQRPFMGEAVVSVYLKNNLKDTDSLRDLECGELYAGESAWEINCRYRAKNSFGGYVVETRRFQLRGNDVIGHN